MARPSSSRFVIVELRRTGAGTYATTPVQFVWTSANHAKPHAPTEIPMAVNTVREIPAGQDRPVEQVVSVAFEPIQFEGIWDDKWGGSGFAWDQYKAFQRMAARVPLARIQWDELEFEGLITNFNASYWHKARIGYSFTLSPHTPAGAGEPMIVPSVKPTRARIDEVSAIVDAIAADHAAGRAATFKDDSYANVGEMIDEMANIIGELNAQNDTFGVVEGAADDLRRAAYRFNRIGGAAQEALTRTANLRSDISASIDTMIEAVKVDIWIRNISANARLLLLRSKESEEDLTARAESTPARVYRPHAGETIYHVAQQITGSSANWRAISQANHLGDRFRFDGTEELVIPADFVQG